MQVNFKGGKYIDEGERLAKSVRKAGWDALRRLGFLVRSKAQQSISNEKGPSAAGTPPHTHPGRGKGQLPKSILYGTVDEGSPSIIIGPSVNVVGTVGRVLEEGGTRFNDKYQPRPFMAPALAAEIGDLPGLLADKLANL